MVLKCIELLDSQSEQWGKLEQKCWKFVEADLTTTVAMDLEVDLLLTEHCRPKYWSNPTHVWQNESHDFGLDEFTANPTSDRDYRHGSKHKPILAHRSLQGNIWQYRYRPDNIPPEILTSRQCNKTNSHHKGNMEAERKGSPFSFFLLRLTFGEAEQHLLVKLHTFPAQHSSHRNFALPPTHYSQDIWNPNRGCQLSH